MPNTFNVYLIPTTTYPIKVFAQNSTVAQSGFTPMGSFTVSDSGYDNLGWTGNHVLYQDIQDILYKAGIYNMQQVIIKNPSSIVLATSITPNQTSVSLKVGNSVIVSNIIAPTNADNTGLTYSSDNPSVAKVIMGLHHTNAVITGISAGTANITVTNGNISSKIPVTVS